MKRSKKYRKEKPEKVGRLVAPVHNFESLTPKYCRKDQRSCDGRGAGGLILHSCDGRVGGAGSAPFGEAMSSKRRVRAAHGRAREAKTH
jgi:hypothetical protein